MIVGFWFRYRPAPDEPMTLVRAPALPYVIASAEGVEPDRNGIPDRVAPCGEEHVCNLCGCKVLDPAPDLEGDDWVEQLSRMLTLRTEVDEWWPHVEAWRLEDLGDPDPYGALRDLGQVELCPPCHTAHGDPTTWPDVLLDRVYGRIGDARVFTGVDVE